MLDPMREYKMERKVGSKQKKAQLDNKDEDYIYFDSL